MSDEIKQYLLNKIPWNSLFAGLLKISLIFFGIWVVSKILSLAMKRLELKFFERNQKAGAQALGESQKRAETLTRLLRRGLFILLWGVAGLMILGELGIEIGPLLASAGIMGLAVGFGAQNLVRDVISGFFMLLENQVRVGDTAIVNGQAGMVEKVNFRTIVLRDVAGSVHIFPNGTINTLANMSLDWSAYVFELGFAYKEDVEQVIHWIDFVSKNMKLDPIFGAMIVEEPEIFGLDQMKDSCVIIKGRIKTLPGQQWVVGREFLKRVKKICDEKGVEIPFPHLSVKFGPNDDPLPIRMIKDS